MNELQIIEEREVLGQDFKVYGTFENPLFLAKDVAKWIEHKDVTSMLRNIDNEEKQKISIRLISGGLQPNTEYWFLTEDGLYEILMQSRKPIAKVFKKEVKKILKEIRLTGTYTTKQPKEELEELKIRAQLERAEAMKLNAKTRMFNTIMKTTNNKVLSPVAVEVFGLKAIEQITGIDMGQHLPQLPKTYSATEIGNMLGVSSNRIGTLAKNHNLKTEENGIWVMDKSKFSSKEVSTFRYFENAINIFRGLLA
ncbi:MAG: Bro-N domain-containing protein [Clostridiales bacterium]|nr:Bro-N domain-containing protein [Clostridiales bacterium]